MEYLRTYWTDFRNLFTIWKRSTCRWWICTSFSKVSRDFTMATKYPRLCHAFLVNLIYNAWWLTLSNALERSTVQRFTIFPLEVRQSTIHLTVYVAWRHPTPFLIRIDYHWLLRVTETVKTRNSAIAAVPREALVSRNPATTKHLTWKPYRMTLFAWFYV